MEVFVCKEPIKITEKEFDRINKLFKIYLDDDTEQMQKLIDELDARPNTMPYTFVWDFKDGNSIVMNIESNDFCYMDNTYLIDKQNPDMDCMFDRDYEIDKQMSYYDGKNYYICEIEIIK